jgi:hypothetical protein
MWRYSLFGRLRGFGGLVQALSSLNRDLLSERAKVLISVLKRSRIACAFERSTAR